MLKRVSSNRCSSDLNFFSGFLAVLRALRLFESAIAKTLFPSASFPSFWHIWNSGLLKLHTRTNHYGSSYCFYKTPLNPEANPTPLYHTSIRTSTLHPVSNLFPITHQNKIPLLSLNLKIRLRLYFNISSCSFGNIHPFASLQALCAN